MKRILVPLDGSASSADALDHVAERRKSGERFDVVALHVQQVVMPTRLVTAAMIKQWQDDESLAAFSQRKAKKLIAQLNAEMHVAKGDPASTIAAIAKKAKCSEIVMATRGIGGIKGMLIGSVANKVAHLAAVPVTLVK